MNKQHHHMSSGAQPKRTIPVPKIVKTAPPAASGTAHPPKPGSLQPLKPANVMKAVQHKHSPWLTTAKIPRNTIPRIP